jgi:hypothetical protein
VRPVVHAMERVGEGTVVRKEADREEVGDLVQLAAGRGVIVKVVQLVASPETKRAKRVELSLLPSREPSPQLRNQARARTPRILSHFGLAEPLSHGLSSSVRDAFGSQGFAFTPVWRIKPHSTCQSGTGVARESTSFPLISLPSLTLCLLLTSACKLRRFPLVFRTDRGYLVRVTKFPYHVVIVWTVGHSLKCHYKELDNSESPDDRTPGSKLPLRSIPTL